MRNHVKTFQPRFADLVEQGIKTQTIRKIPVVMPAIGDTISLRKWEGVPRRKGSKHTVIGLGIISHVSPVTIDHEGVRGLDAESIALDDGFQDWAEMRDWFDKTHGLPFYGILIGWW